jgi:shikimate dehydrogenase
MPLKRAVLPLLDQAEQLVTDVGGANTVVLRDGRRAGYNTDVPGMVAALREAGVRVSGEVLVLGGGATAGSALAALQRAGAGEVAVAVRDAARAGPVREVADHLGMHIRLAELAAQGVALAGARQAWQLVISTVPAGAADVVARQVAAGDVTAEAVFDVVYEPWPTLLAQAAMAAGATVISGFELLLQQAAGQVELMTGQQAPVAAMRAAGLAEIARRRGLEQDQR